MLVEPADAFLNQGEVQPGGAGLGRGFEGEVVADRFAGGEVVRQGSAFAVEFEPAIVRGLPVVAEVDRTLAGAVPGFNSSRGIPLNGYDPGFMMTSLAQPFNFA